MIICLAFFLIETFFDPVISLEIQDVLNGNLLPSSLILEGIETSAILNQVVNQTDPIISGDFDNALHTMEFHRKMMNEYLCRSYVAEQILDEMAPQRRSGEPAPNALPSRKTKEKKRNHDNLLKENMLDDSGSEGYKNWLSRSSTLEDIYRQYEDTRRITNEELPVPVAVPAGYGGEIGHLQHSLASFPQRGYHFGKVDSGVSGYGGAETAYGSAGGYPESTHGGYGGSSSGGGPWHGGSSGPWQGGGSSGPWHGGGGGGGGVWVYHHDDSEGSDEKSEKGMKLKDLFDLALTALAFLAFGAFKVQLLLCLTNNGTVTSTTAAPMMANLIVRNRRSEELPGTTLDIDIEDDEMDVEDESVTGDTTGINPLYEWDHLSMFAVRAMDAATLLDETRPSSNKAQDCLRRQICEGNRVTRQMSGMQRIWMPVWNFAMSWVSGRAYADGDSERLENLKASLLGLANARCEFLYAACSIEDLSRMREERKAKRRRKRRGDPGDWKKMPS